VAEALAALAGGAEEEALADLVAGRAPGGLARFYYELDRLDRAGVLCRSVGQEGALLATLEPHFPCPRRQASPDRPYLLSRFALVRREGEGLVLECPLGRARVLLHQGRAAALLEGLARPRSPAEVARQVPGLEDRTATELVGLLLAAGAAGEPGAMPEDASPALAGWEPHDLFMHVRSRRGRHRYPLGATWPGAAQPPPPALEPAPPGPGLALVRPDLERALLQDPPLAWVLEARRSRRDYGAEPMSVEQLGEFLYRVGRVRGRRTAAVPSSPWTLEAALRPYPGGGALYELEIYPVVGQCRGLAPGLYRYHPEEHRLYELRGPGPQVEELLAGAAAATGQPLRPQVLLVLAARFPRLAYKYASIAYATVLKDVGVLYQTMYLTATAMGLAACALGSGDSDLFARAAGTDYYSQTSVGEFLLGSAP
jgi:SagB-type dehydrogenase family enzyme